MGVIGLLGKRVNHRFNEYCIADYDTDPPLDLMSHLVC